MAKGDYVKVKTNINGVVDERTITVTSAGGTVEVEFPTPDPKTRAVPPPFVAVNLLGRTGKVRRGYRFALSAILVIEEEHRDAG